MWQPLSFSKVHLPDHFSAPDCYFCPCNRITTPRAPAPCTTSLPFFLFLLTPLASSVNTSLDLARLLFYGISATDSFTASSHPVSCHHGVATANCAQAIDRHELSSRITLLCCATRAVVLLSTSFFFFTWQPAIATRSALEATTRSILEVVAAAHPAAYPEYRYHGGRYTSSSGEFSRQHFAT